MGDDICAYAGKYAVEQVDPNAEVIVSAPPMKVSDIKWADYIILSGGGILYDREPSNVENYLQYIDKASKLGKKSAVLGVGVQGIVTEEGKRRYKKSLSKCEFVSVRTKKDKQLLDETGFTDSVATFDIAYLTPSYVKEIKSSFWKRYKDKPKPKNKPRVGICMINLRMLKGDAYDGVFKEFDNTIEKFIDQARKDFDIFLIQHANEDAKVMKPLAYKYDITFVPYKSIQDLPGLFRLYKTLDLMIGVRLHSIALGIMAEVPVIGIGSSSAKQLRLANYGLPTLKSQFYTFNNVKKLSKSLQRITDDKSIHQNILSTDEYSYITSMNNENLKLLREMVA